jgi:hypothetical protein
MAEFDNSITLTLRRPVKVVGGVFWRPFRVHFEITRIVPEIEITGRIECLDEHYEECAELVRRKIKEISRSLQLEPGRVEVNG